MATTSGPRLIASRGKALQQTLEREDTEGDVGVNGDGTGASNGDLHTYITSLQDLAGEEESPPGSAASLAAELRRDNSAVGFDTDLEIDDEKEDYDISGARVYLESCKDLGVVPASYFIRHMSKPVLVMRHHGLGPLGAKAIAIPLVSNTLVNELDLEDNWLEKRGATYIADMLKENCYITNLNLANNRIGSDAVKTICEMLMTNTTLTHVNLSGNGFLPKDAQYFAQALLENTRITCLNLSQNAFGEDTGDLIGHAVGENESLERLDLSWNNFRRDSGNKLLDGLQVNSRLKCVNLAWNGLGLDCAPALSACLRNNSILTELDVSNNRINPEAALIIAKGLEANETLKILRIGGNPMGPAGAIALLAGINNERSILTLLDLSDVWVEDDFQKLYTEIRESRPDFEVKHGGILGQPGWGQKKPGGESALERFIKNDPMMIIKQYLDEKNLRLLDLFLCFDKNRDSKITPKEFQEGVKTAGIPLTPEQIDALIEKLDSEVDADGKVDYKEFALGAGETQKKLRDLTKSSTPT